MHFEAEEQIMEIITVTFLYTSCGTLGMRPKRKSYPSDVTDEEWAFCAPYLTLMKEEAPQREHSLREILKSLRYLVRAACPWLLMPNDVPPWHKMHQQTIQWIRAKCFETMAHDLRAMLRALLERKEDPTAAIYDSRTVQSTPESGERAGYDAGKKRKGSKVHIAVDTFGAPLGVEGHSRHLRRLRSGLVFVVPGGDILLARVKALCQDLIDPLPARWRERNGATCGSIKTSLFSGRSTESNGRKTPCS